MTLHFEMLQSTDDKWLEMADKIAQVSWRAGQSLADKMRSNHFSDWEVVMVGLAETEEIACFCTISKEDGLLDSTLTPFIGYVFVSENCRGQRVSEKLLTQAESYLKEIGFGEVHVVSGEIGLYEKYGYRALTQSETVHGAVETVFVKEL